MQDIVNDAVDGERARIVKIIEEMDRPQAIRLMAGEMTAQEMRTVRAVLGGLKAKIENETLRKRLTPPAS